MPEDTGFLVETREPGIKVHFLWKAKICMSVEGPLGPHFSAHVVWEGLAVSQAQGWGVTLAQANRQRPSFHFLVQ